MLEFGGDLCVMGCYGHSRFREMILGGVSREHAERGSIPDSPVELSAGHAGHGA